MPEVKNKKTKKGLKRNESKVEKESTKKKDSGGSTGEDFSWGGFVQQMLGSFFEKFLQGIHSKIDEVMLETKKSVIISSLVVLGVVFLFVGAGKIFDRLLGVEGAGFLLIGFVLSFFGLIFSCLNKK